MNEQPSTPGEEGPVDARPVAYTGVPPWPPIAVSLSAKLYEMTLPHVGKREAWLDLALAFGATVVLPYMPVLCVAPFLDGEREYFSSQVGVLEIVQVWTQAVLGMMFLLYFIHRQKIRASSFGLRLDGFPFQLAWGGAALIGVYAMLFASGALVMCLLLIYPEAQEGLTQRLDYVEQMPLDNIGVTVVLLIAVAINEEVVFRGLLIPYLRRVSGSWWLAGGISSAIFAALHIPDQGLLGGGFQIFAVGAALAAFFIFSRSLLAVTIAHFLFNLLQFQVVRMLPDLEQLMENAGG